MNIAFYTYNKCIPYIGGTERTTALVVEKLIELYQYNIFSIYSNEIYSTEKMPPFSGYLQINETTPETAICEYIISNGISIIINQGDFQFGIMLGKIINRYKLKCTQIFALHFAPAAYEKSYISLSEKVRQIKLHPHLRTIVKVVFFPIYHYVANEIYKHRYREIIKYTSTIVLLSQRYESEWFLYAYGKHALKYAIRKFQFIPNALTFTKQNISITEKKKKILIVTRLDERQKKISRALTIWREISSRPETAEWELDIVGDGIDRGEYELMVTKQNISRVHFYGRQNPQYFYQRSSIFLMTSDFEGWPLTLVEALQFGVVPIALDTFSALHDIIIDNKNGYIIPSNDLQLFKEKLFYLINNDKLRHKMAEQAIESIDRFSPNIIAAKWHKLLSQISE